MSNSKQQAKKMRNKRRQQTNQSNRELGSVGRPFVIPPTLHVKLRYLSVEQPTGSVSKAHSCALNGVYDPDITHAGHQPMGFDQWMAFYSRYEVIKSTYIYRFVNFGSVPVGITVYPSLSATIGTFEAAAEQPYSKRVIVSGAGGIDRATVRLSMSPQQFIGRVTDSVNYTGSSSGNPSIVIYWNQVIESLDGSTSVTGYAELEIDYVVKLYDRITLAQS